MTEEIFKECPKCHDQMIRLEKPWDVINGWLCWGCGYVVDDDGVEY